MPTTVTKTIGSGGDYATPQIWFDAGKTTYPSGLVIGDAVWQGKILNASDSFTSSSGTPVLVMSGSTTDATRYFDLTTAAGASFRDNAGVQTTALRYNIGVGCSISTTTASATAIVVNQDYTRISNLQISALGSAINLGGVGALNCDINNCILDGNSSVSGALFMYGAGNKVRNSLIVQRYASGAASFIAELRNGAAAYNCTFAVPSDLTAAAVGLQGAYSAATVTNCVIVGCTALDGGTAPTYTTCASNVTAGTGHIHVTYDTNLFAGITDAARDYRLPNVSALLDVGTTDATNAATDIAGTARPSGAGYDIGCWERVVAVAPVLSAATAVSITSTTATPRVTVTLS